MNCDPTSCEFSVARRRLIQAAGLGMITAACSKVPDPLLATDVARVDKSQLGAMTRPVDYEQLGNTIADWAGAICIAGGKYSMGGQTRQDGALQVDMRGLNSVVWVDEERKIVRVGAGITWRELIEVLDPLGLSVKVMQSYSNFTVGGSLGVNCHGRYVNEGAISGTVRALSILTVGWGHPRVES